MRIAECIATYGIDLGKSKFHVVGLDQNGRTTLRTNFRRDSVLQFFANSPAALIGMEACPGSHWLARKLSGCGAHGPNHSPSIRQAVRNGVGLFHQEFWSVLGDD